MRFLSALVAMLLLATSVLGTAMAQATRKVALVIGNGAYAHAGTLRNPLNDAADVAAKLQALGFEVIVGTNRDGRAMTALVRDFRARLSGAAVGLFYYAGHAIQVGGQNHLLPVDADLQDELDVERQTIRLQSIVEEMERTAPVNLVFLDACRDNPLSQKLKSTLGSRGRSAMLGRGLAPVAGAAADTLVVFAAAPGEVADDGEGRNSPFTAALLKHIDKREEISLMLKDVIADVRAATKGKQRPQQLAAMEKRFYLAGVEAAPGPKEPTSPAPAAPPAPSIWPWAKPTDKSVVHELTIEPGLTNHAIFALLNGEARLSGTIERAPAEGSLLPGVYKFKAGDPRQKLIDDMIAAHKLAVEALLSEALQRGPTLIAPDALIVASIVEKETGRAEDRAKIAAVLINRLKKNMRLESDATLAYAITGGKGKLDRPFTKSDTKLQSPYNTYVVDGLPPTPICNPSREAIEAAFNPAPIDALYYDPDGMGGHVFSTALVELKKAPAPRKVSTIVVPDPAAPLPARHYVIVTLKGLGTGVAAMPAIAAAQDRVLRDVGISGDAIVRRYDRLPQLALLLNDSQIALARSHPLVASVAADAAVPLPSPAPPKEQTAPGTIVTVLASRKSLLEAMEAMADLHQKFPDILGALQLTFIESKTSNGTWYRVVAGPAGSMEAAKDLCAKLKAKGYSDCWPTKF